MLTFEQCQELHVVTEDGVTVHKGDGVYNYYDMKPGVIGKIGYPYETEGQPLNHKRDVWFDCDHADGTRSILNGERICSWIFARNRGFKGT